MNLGVIGMGRTGSMVGLAAKALGMDVRYFNRSRKAHVEARGIDYLPLPELMAVSDAITTHLPRGSLVVGRPEFANTRSDAILINTSLGPTYDQEACLDWLNSGQRHLILDADGASDLLPVLANHPRATSNEVVAGWTAQARARLSDKVVSNVEAYLANQRPETQA